MKPVNPIKITKNMSVFSLLDAMRNSGVFGAGKLGSAANIWKQMLNEKECTKFFGVAGALVPGGMRDILIDIIESRAIDVFVTTGANLTHDLVEALGHRHFIGSHHADDAALEKEGYVRMYDSYMKSNVYPDLEDFLNPILDTIKEPITISQLLNKIGLAVKKRSILSACIKNNIPVFCPALADSGIGQMIWGYLAKGKKLQVDAFRDLLDINDLAWTSKRAGVIYLGGGVPKNFIQQAMQFRKEGADYGIQITTDRPEPGGSSGAPLKEGISWSKMKPSANFVDVFCDVTIALPLLWASIKNQTKDL